MEASQHIKTYQPCVLQARFMHWIVYLSKQFYKIIIIIFALFIMQKKETESQRG